MLVTHVLQFQWIDLRGPWTNDKVLFELITHLLLLLAHSPAPVSLAIQTVRVNTCTVS